MKQLLLYSIIGVIGFLLLIFMHEQAHVAIYSSYNIDSHVEYFSHFPSIITMPDKDCPNDACITDHINNEIFGYHAEIIYILLFFIGLFIIGELEVLNEKSEKMQ